MTYSATVPYTYNGVNPIYGKPVPAGSSPSEVSGWDGDVIYADSYGAGSAVFVDLADGIPYWIYEQADDSPLNTDPQIAVISPDGAAAPTVAEILAAFKADAQLGTATGGLVANAEAIKAKTDLVGTIRSLIRW